MALFAIDIIKSYNLSNNIIYYYLYLINLILKNQLIKSYLLNYW